MYSPVWLIGLIVWIVCLLIEAPRFKQTPRGWLLAEISLFSGSLVGFLAGLIH